MQIRANTLIGSEIANRLMFGNVAWNLQNVDIIKRKEKKLDKTISKVVNRLVTLRKCNRSIGTYKCFFLNNVVKVLSMVFHCRLESVPNLYFFAMLIRCETFGRP